MGGISSRSKSDRAAPTSDAVGHTPYQGRQALHLYQPVKPTPLPPQPYQRPTKSNFVNCYTYPQPSSSIHGASQMFSSSSRTIQPPPQVYPQPAMSFQVPPITHPQPARSIEIPSSYMIWKEQYLKYKVSSEDYAQFSTRISNNTDELIRKQDDKIHQLKLQRISESSKLFSEKESPKPNISINSCLNIRPRLERLKEYDSRYFSTEKKLPELTPQMQSEIEWASNPNPPNEALVEIDGVQILRKDIRTLLGLSWLNDEIINAYMSLLVARGGKSNFKKVYSFNTFFYPKLRESGYNSVRRWTRKVDVFSYDFILVPVHLGNHWCLAFIDFTTRTISYYDSLGGYTNGCCDTLLDYLRMESNDKKKQNFDDENWRLIDKYSEDTIPQQNNCSDCGVFACMYAEFLTRQAKLKFGQEHMPYFRKKMIYEIIKKTILV